MLENFSDQEIEGDLLDTGYLYLELPGGLRKRIEHIAVDERQTMRNRYVLEKDGEGPRRYRNLIELFDSEAVNFKEIRAAWKYHGVLLGAPSFCEKLVHDPGCGCSTCQPVEPVSHPFIDWCRLRIASEDSIILDTETTGLKEPYGEVIDLAIIDMRGKELYNSLLKPLGPISQKARETHHITEAMLEHAPTIAEEWHEVCRLVNGRTVITYNAAFDSARIAYSLDKYKVNTCEMCRWSFECAMLRYATFYDAPPRWEGSGPAWQSLSQACWQQGIRLNLSAMHRAMADCKATLSLLCKIAAAGENSLRHMDIGL